ncbi:nicotinamide mononucleotide transporter [Acetobacteraceae bacterium]|nr:nicotinamide mononucleotide transporter [Acetobacteraceae bacterium]
MGLSILQIIELFASLSAAIGATLIMFPRRSGWLFLLMSGLLYIFIFGYNKLYATLALQLGFASLSLYGLISWSKKSQAPQDFCPLIYSPLYILRDLSLAALGSFLWAELLAHVTDDPHPYWDGTLSIYAMLAQYWMSRAYLCHWILWLVADGAYATSLFCWGLPMSGLLYAYLALLSIVGLFHWSRILRQKRA